MDEEWIDWVEKCRLISESKKIFSETEEVIGPKIMIPLTCSHWKISFARVQKYDKFCYLGREEQQEILMHSAESRAEEVKNAKQEDWFKAWFCAVENIDTDIEPKFRMH